MEAKSHCKVHYGDEDENEEVELEEFYDYSSRCLSFCFLNFQFLQLQINTVPELSLLYIFYDLCHIVTLMEVATSSYRQGLETILSSLVVVELSSS